MFTPANTAFENAISVAATDGHWGLANFSNYGVNTVDIAARGVEISSTVPGEKGMPMSGTSMAAPFVSKIAGMIKDINPKLTAVQIKKILMETVDKKSFLTNKVKSGGIVNQPRSKQAAFLSLTLSLDLAMAQSNAELP